MGGADLEKSLNHCDFFILLEFLGILLEFQLAMLDSDPKSSVYFNF